MTRRDVSEKLRQINITFVQNGNRLIIDILLYQRNKPFFYTLQNTKKTTRK
jgi:hypothetical protein